MEKRNQERDNHDDNEVERKRKHAQSKEKRQRREKREKSRIRPEDLPHFCRNCTVKDIRKPLPSFYLYAIPLGKLIALIGDDLGDLPLGNGFQRCPLFFELSCKILRKKLVNRHERVCVCRTLQVGHGSGKKP